jgi:uncharacterized protein YbaR (Trm112 family)
MKTDIICPKCDEAFSVEYSKYSSQKTVKCPTCRTVLDIVKEKVDNEHINTDVNTSVSENIKSKEFSYSWHIENRYMHSGVICFTLGIFFLGTSLYSFNIYVTFFILALVFGVLTVIDKKPLHGIILIVVTVLVAGFMQNILINNEVDEFTQQINDQTAEMEESFKILEKQFLKILK